MNCLLDTHILLWAATDQLSERAASYVLDEKNTLYFSAASIWEVVIKSGLGREDFDVNPSLLYQGLLNAGYVELDITPEHVLGVEKLPDIHKDPFDRILLAQAIEDHLTLLTADSTLSQYKGPIIHV